MLVCLYRQTLDGSFSAVSRPILASKKIIFRYHFSRSARFAILLTAENFRQHFGELFFIFKAFCKLENVFLLFLVDPVDVHADFDRNFTN